MPACDDCGTNQSKLNQGKWCKACFSKMYNDIPTTEAKDANVNEHLSIAGIQLSDIEQIPDLSTNSLNAPITTGIMLKIIADVIQPINKRLDDHEKRISALEEKCVSTENTIKSAQKDISDTQNKLRWYGSYDC